MKSEILNREIDGIRVLTLGVENLDAATCSRVREDLLKKIQGGESVILDAQFVQFADSSGLGLLRTLTNHVGPTRFALANVSSRLRRCLERLPADRIPRTIDNIETVATSFCEATPNVPEESCVLQTN